MYNSKLVKTVAIAGSVLQNYTGEYAMTADFHFTISKDGDHMYCQATGQNKFEIFPEAQNRFFAKVAVLEIEFVRDDNGKVLKLNLRLPVSI